MGSRFWNPTVIFSAAILLRLVLLAWGRYQDTHSPLKYTDIDYLVFTDAARFASRGHSPYQRDTYRYTPLLAWLLYPTVYDGFFDFGKWLFALGDIIAGALTYSILRGDRYSFDKERASKYAAVWVLNPMVANISTRGSSEGLLAVFVVAILWAMLSRRYRLTGILLGLAVHFKIYPFIYAASLAWWLRCEQLKRGKYGFSGIVSRDLLDIAIPAALSFTGLNAIMYWKYGHEFLEHSYLYHLVRIDHRHNFSIYSALLHLRSAVGSGANFRLETVAFVPQLFLAVVAIPLTISGKDLAGAMLAQTFAFVTFNKVCTSQYFLWYLVFLPFYLPDSVFMKSGKLGVLSLIAWVAGQAVWLQQGYNLEFLGESTFVPGLWLANIFFFGINCVILGIIVGDVASQSTVVVSSKKTD